jgi:hypothetical protein
MNRDENKYQRGKIYKIISYQTDKVYIGLTCKIYLNNRLAKHNNQYKNYLNGLHNYIMLFEILKYNDAKIVLIESYPCNSKEKLFAKEAEWIIQSNCINKEIPNRTQKQYRKDNKEKIQKLQKDYRINNKKKLDNYQKDWK